jgi:hypothetical protein
MEHYLRRDDLARAKAETIDETTGAVKSFSLTH